MSDPDPREDRSSSAPPRPPGTFRLGTIAGSDVLVSASWFLIAGLIAIVVAPRAEQLVPGLGVWAYVAGLAFAIILYGSVLLHEAAHLYVARHYGYPVGAITLGFLGGATAVEGEARRPRHEFWIAVIGPVTSLVIGGIALVVLFGLEPDGLILMAVEGLAGANLLVGVMNLLPGLPLDGGRVLKSLVWALSRNVHRGTIVAGWGGRLTAIAVLALPFVMEPLWGLRPDILTYALAFIVALFLWTGATAAMAHARLRSKLPALLARNLARRTLAVPDDLPVAEAVRRAQETGAGSIITVTPSGTPVGVVNEAALLAVGEDRRPWMAISHVTRRLGDGLSLPADIAGEELIKAITRTPAAEYLLLEEDGSIYGVLATVDVDAAFREGGR